MWKKWRLLTSRETLLGVGVLGMIGFGAVCFRYLDGEYHDTRPTVSGSDLAKGEWSFMPGAASEAGGLRVTPIPFSIVQQDGSDPRANPPINLFGTHLEKVSDVVIEATIHGLEDQAVLEFYGKPPVIADELRIERGSLRLTLAADSLRAEVRTESAQGPIAAETFSLDLKKYSRELRIEHKGGVFSFTVDGKAVGDLPAHNIFQGKSVWFGFDGTAPWKLTDLEARAPKGADLVVADSTRLHADQDNGGLQLLANKRRSNFRIGAALALGPAVADPDYRQVAFGGNFGSVTPENALKWQFVHPEPDTYTFQEADALITLAKRHKMTVHGHSLVFGEANPPWVRSLPADQAEQVMLDHIKTVVGHYKGNVASWDVVNEPLADYDDFILGSQELRNHLWFQAMGEGYVAKALRAAHQADPKAKLFINEYGLEEDGERWDALVELLKRLQAEDVPIDGVGFQSHVYEPTDRIDPVVLRRHVRELASLGLEARISEIDVYSDDGTDAQASQYADVLDVCISEPNCVSFTTWGVSDRYNFWVDDEGTLQQGQDFLWNKDMLPTMAVDKIRDLLH